MTRDEAIAIFKNKPVGKEWEADWVDKLSALGVLKLDEPKGPRERFIDAMFGHPNAAHGLITPRFALDALDKAGLKIVEK